MKLAFFLLAYFVVVSGAGQDYTTFQKRLSSLYELSTVTDSSERATQFKVIFKRLIAEEQIPLREKDSVAFFYFGKAQEVKWMGDFNGWGYKADFNNKGTQIKGTDIWVLKASFPTDARLDYKIVVDNKNWLLDVNNPHQQWSGVGGGSPNSELRMPDYKEDPVHTQRDNVSKGKVIQDILYSSNLLSYQITYSVYLPPAPRKGKYPVVYITDGYEYLHPQMGNLPTVLDNLIADHKIVPIVAVFIDHREPANRTNNRRMTELVMNPQYLQFFVDEFIPYIEDNYPVMTSAENRAILGSSVGGLNATYFAFSRPDVFSNVGIQSPSFMTRPQIYSLCDNPAGSKIKLSMTSGLINDTSDSGRKMISILENNACTYQYREVNEGHSWGNWKNLEDDILMDFFAPKQ
ncbi:MAG: alpha/beta hydrolase-fold protein [Cyclobacteriaceae bacterium]